MYLKKLKRTLLGMSLLFAFAGLQIFSSSTVAAESSRKISFWVSDPGYMEAIDAAKRDYMDAHPDVKIEALMYTGRAILEKIAMALPVGRGGDILDVTPYEIAPYIDKGYIMELPPRAREYTNKHIFPEYQDGGVYKGGLYGFAIVNESKALFWNRVLFAEAGLNRPPENWEELIAYSQKIAKRDAGGNLIRSGVSLRLTGGGYGVAEKWWAFLLQAGGTVMEKTPSGKYHNGYNNQTGWDALRLYIDLLYKYKVDGYLVAHDVDAFKTQNTGMFDRESWVIGEMEKGAPDVSYGTAPLIGYKQRGTASAARVLCVPKSTANPDTVWDFVMFLARPEYQELWMRKGGWSAVSDTVNFEEIFQEVPQWRAFYEYPEGYKVWLYPNEKVTFEIYTKLAQRLVEAFRNQNLVDNPEGLKKVISTAAEETDRILKKAGIYGTD